MDEDKQPSQLWDGDLFNRSDYAEFLKKFLVSSSHSQVVGLDAAWGAGKTFFVHKWSEQLKSENYPCLYINAWESDFAKEPLIPILHAVNQSMEGMLIDDQVLTSKFRDVSDKLINSFRNVLPTLTDTIVSHYTDQDSAGELAKALVDGTSLSKSDAMKEFECANQLVLEFKDCLRESIKALDANYELPLFLFIDELDRCKPTYAIELLERVKHIFEAENVVFVISTDKTQLCHSIKAVYGNDFDSLGYLNRFFDHQVTLPLPNREQFTASLMETHKDLIYECEFLPEFEDREFLKLASNLATGFKLELRDIQQCFMKFISVVSQLRTTTIHHAYLIFLVMLYFKKPQTFTAQLKNGSLTKEIIGKFIENDIKILLFYEEISLDEFIFNYCKYANYSKSKLRNLLTQLTASDQGYFETHLHNIYHDIDMLNNYASLVELSGYISE